SSRWCASSRQVSSTRSSPGMVVRSRRAGRTARPSRRSGPRPDALRVPALPGRAASHRSRLPTLEHEVVGHQALAVFLDRRGAPAVRQLDANPERIPLHFVDAKPVTITPGPPDVDGAGSSPCVDLHLPFLLDLLAPGEDEASTGDPHAQPLLPDRPPEW